MNTSLEPAQWHRRFCAVTPWLALSGDLDTTVASNAERQLTEWIDNGVTHIVDLRGEWNDDEFVAERAPELAYHWLGTHDEGGHQTDEWYESGLRSTGRSGPLTDMRWCTAIWASTADRRWATAGCSSPVSIRWRR